MREKRGSLQPWALEWERGDQSWTCPFPQDTDFESFSILALALCSGDRKLDKCTSQVRIQRHPALHNFEKAPVYFCEGLSCGTRCWEHTCWSLEENVGGDVTETWVAGALAWIYPIIETELPPGKSGRCENGMNTAPPWGAQNPVEAGRGLLHKMWQVLLRRMWGQWGAEENNWVLTTYSPGSHGIWCALWQQASHWLAFATSSRSPKMTGHGFPENWTMSLQRHPLSSLPCAALLLGPVQHQFIIISGITQHRLEWWVLLKTIRIVKTATSCLFNI